MVFSSVLAMECADSKNDSIDLQISTSGSSRFSLSFIFFSYPIKICIIVVNILWLLIYGTYEIFSCLSILIQNLTLGIFVQFLLLLQSFPTKSKSGMILEQRNNKELELEDQMRPEQIAYFSSLMYSRNYYCFI